MPGAEDGERGGTAVLQTPTATHVRPDLATSTSHAPRRTAVITAAQPHASSRRPLNEVDSENSSNPTPPDTQSTLTTPFSLPHSNLDLRARETLGGNGLLQDTYFPDWKDDAYGGSVDSPEEMQKKDPLGTQIWKLYTRTKSRLPNQERMENLTWRMMAMNLRRREQIQAQYVSLGQKSSPNTQALTTASLRSTQSNSSTPTPTSVDVTRAQLRDPLEQPSEQPSDPMNLDEFIQPSVVAPPTGIIPTTPSRPGIETRGQKITNSASAVPIGVRNKPDGQIPLVTIPAASLPKTAGPTTRPGEFDYVQKRVRKTSIDERRVWCTLGLGRSELIP